MRLADESNDHVLFASFLQDDLGMTGGDDLRLLCGSSLSEEGIDVPLTKDFKMCVRFVKQQDGTRIGHDIGQQQENLLATTTGATDVEFRA